MTDITLIGVDLTYLDTIDNIESLIWTDRYCGSGDFQITTNASKEMVSNFVVNRYLSRKDSDHIMIIEDIFVRSNAEAGNTIVAKGRSLESILDRRILWTQTILTGNLQSEIERQLNENMIAPSDASRTIPNFIFEASIDPAITAIVIDSAQFDIGTNLYEIVNKLCAAANLGYQVTLSEDNKFIFKLYAGADRSYEQFDNPYIEFSSDFDNLLSSEYSESNQTLKTLALVAGEGDVSTDKTFIVVQSDVSLTGLSRREAFVDGAGISRTTDSGTLTEEEYVAQLAQKGIDDLTNYAFKSTFEGELDPFRTYVFNEDFFMGDVLQIADEYGNEGKSRVIEVIFSEDGSGTKLIPTFLAIE